MIIKVSVNKEQNFEQFLKKFGTDSTFQVTRVKFPLLNKLYDSGSDIYETETISIDEWGFLDLRKPDYKKEFLKVSSNSYKLNVSVKETGVFVTYVFTNINDKWYLTVVEDRST